MGQFGRERSDSGSGTLNNNTGEIENANTTVSPITDTLLHKAGKPLNEVVDDVSFLFCFLFQSSTYPTALHNNALNNV